MDSEGPLFNSQEGGRLPIRVMVPCNEMSLLRHRTLPNNGALPYWQRDARTLTEVVQLRVLAHFGLPSSAGCAGNRMLAAMACALTPPGQRTVIDDCPEAVAAFLRPQPVRELPGVGAKTAATLAEYGLHTVGDVADVHEHAHGRDTTIVDPTPTPSSLSAEHRFARDELDPAAHRRVLLALADDLGARLRTSGQIATGVTLTVRYADLTATRRSRTLTEATQHTVLLARAAYAVYDSLGLQRARVRSIAVRADSLRADDLATRQLTLDAGDDKPLAIEAVADRARARYGRQVIYPAALAISSRSSSAHHGDRGGPPDGPLGGGAT